MECAMQVDNVERLTGGQLSQVLGLVKAATDVDETAPLSEQVLLAARGGHAAIATTGSPHFLAYAGTHLAGYAHLEAGLTGEAATAEVVVDPSCRRRGVGTALIHALQDALANALDDALAPRAPVLRLWSHGHLDGARAFARRDGYSVLRELWQMRRSLRSDVGVLPAVSLPEGFSARHFVVGRDENAWLRVNANAFVNHPEQGRMTRLDLDRRVAQPWFDATGFILIEDIRGKTPVLAASHWTKVVPAEGPGTHPAPHLAPPTLSCSFLLNGRSRAGNWALTVEGSGVMW